tara:strand:+ start:234 stop:473 length:240 start_codon:yes stop_codon:yes gene_type:complete
MKIINTLLFLFLLLFATHSFAKSKEYYQQTLIHVLTECNSDCKKRVFEKEINTAIFALIDAVLNQISFEISQKKKELLQ